MVREEWNGTSRTDTFLHLRLGTKYYFERKKRERERAWSVASYYSRSCYDNIFSRNKGHLCDALAPRLVRSIRGCRCKAHRRAMIIYSFLIFPNETLEYPDTLVLFRSCSSWMHRVITISRFPIPTRWNIDIYFAVIFRFLFNSCR